jgi:hypothetical protein
MTAPGQRVRHDRLTNSALAASFGTRPYTKRKKESPGGEAGAGPKRENIQGDSRRADARGPARLAEPVTSASCFPQAVRCRRRHQPRRPPLAKIRPGRPAPARGAGTGVGSARTSVKSSLPTMW